MGICKISILLRDEIVLKLLAFAPLLSLTTPGEGSEAAAHCNLPLGLLYPVSR